MDAFGLLFNIALSYLANRKITEQTRASQEEKAKVPQPQLESNQLAKNSTANPTRVNKAVPPLNLNKV